VITGWLLKIVLVIGIIGFLAVEGGSPLIVRAQLDGAAHDAANDAAAEYLSSHNVDTARARADADAAKEGGTVQAFEIDSQNVVHVTVYKQARSVLLRKWNKLKSWYDVRVSVTSASRGK
jgi:hypothetical protein